MAVFSCKFFHEEDGNATIDWIVLTASLVILGLTIGYVVSNGANDVATEINTSLGSLEPSNQNS
ncbi:MAG: hypothetical protein KUG58_00845 [Marinosulfonomonas sp.]|nr:hypothetical protein [Marinosulfonomonas sp.]